MSGGVLAVMDRDAADAENYRRDSSAHYADAGVRESTEARATVERLAEAAQAMLDAPSGGAGEVNAAVELMAALAAFRGEA